MKTGRQGVLGRRDANERDIIAAFRQCGCQVEQLSGPLDLAVGHRGNIWLIEVKDGAKPPSKRKLTPAEEKFMEQWSGYPVHIVETVDDVLDLVNGSVPR